MKQTFTPLNIVDSFSCLRNHVPVLLKRDRIHYSYATSLVVGLFLLVSGSASGQQLQQLDTYLAKTDKESVSAKHGETSSQTSSQAQSIKSQLYDLASTVYWQDGKENLHQTGRLVRIVTTTKDLSGISGVAEKMGDELISIRTLVLTVPDEAAMQKIQAADLNVYEMLPSLERVFFIMEYEADARSTKSLQSKLPQPPKNQIENQPDAPERAPVVFLYKTSIPS